VLELAAARAGRPLPVPPVGTPAQVAQDEAYWREIAAQFAITDAVTNLEAGFWGMMAAPVLAAYHRNVDRVNRESSYFARREYPAIFGEVRQQVAATPARSLSRGMPPKRCSPSSVSTIACSPATPYSTPTSITPRCRWR
jgi:hypothetical protein